MLPTSHILHTNFSHIQDMFNDIAAIYIPTSGSLYATRVKKSARKWFPSLSPRVHVLFQTPIKPALYGTGGHFGPCSFIAEFNSMLYSRHYIRSIIILVTIKASISNVLKFANVKGNRFTEHNFNIG